MTSSTRDRSDRRGRLQAILAATFACLTVLALLVPLWFEELTGFSPDGGNGEFELLLAVPFGIASMICGLLALRTRRAAKAS